MHYLKLFLLLFILLIQTGFSYDSKPAVIKWVISKECSLRVNGSTNVNKFDCVISAYYKPDTITFFQNASSETIKMTGSMKLDIASFDCHNPMMTADLRKTLKAKEYPKLTIRFLSINKYPDDNHQKIKGQVAIELAGVNKRFDIDYTLKKEGANALTLTGARVIKFSDFSIIPPRKLGGMIQTNDDLNIEFNLKMKILD